MRHYSLNSYKIPLSVNKHTANMGELFYYTKF